MLVDILEEHLDEAIALAESRQLAFQMLDMTEENLEELDDRLRANLDGLLLGGEASWELCHEFLNDGQPGEAFVAGIIALEGAQTRWLDQLHQAINTPSKETAEGIRWACCLTVSQDIAGFLHRQLRDGEPPAKAIALEALAFRKIDPGPVVDEAIQASPVDLRAAGIRAAGLFRMTRHVGALDAFACSGEAEVCGVALEGLFRIDPDRAHRRCHEILQGDGPASPVAATILGVGGRPGDLDSLVRASASEDRSVVRSAILAMGTLGYVAAVPTLIGKLGDPGLAGVAGVALLRILGPSLPEVEASPGESTEGEDVPEENDWGPDDDLPRYSAKAVNEWWIDNEGSFAAAQRYRGGEKLIPGASLPETPIELRHHEELERLLASATGE